MDANQKNSARNIINQQITSSELHASLAVNVYMSTIRSKLNGHRIHCRSARKKPLFLTKNNDTRLNFVREDLEKTDISGSPFGGQMS